MRIIQKRWVAITVGIVVAALVACAGWYYFTKVRVPVFPINPHDTITSWNFKGAYTGNDALIAKANADSAHLRSLLGKGVYDNYDLYIGIGNDDNLMGDGMGAYQNYDHAIYISPNKGLAYMNLGYLMDELGAYYTAADAYAKSVAVEPSVLEYQLARLTFLTQQFPTNNQMVLAAFTDASKQFGDAAPILSIEAQWLTGQGRYAEAITAWKKVEVLAPGVNTAAINAAIAQLRSKEKS